MIQRRHCRRGLALGASLNPTLASGACWLDEIGRGSVPFLGSIGSATDRSQLHVTGLPPFYHPAG